MNALPDFPHLDSPEKCAALKARYPGKVVGLWATGNPRQNVDVLWRLRRELLRLGVPAPQIWLLLPQRALLPRLEGASPLDRDFPYELPLHVDRWLTSALGSLPLRQSVGVIRHCLRKDPRLAATALLFAATSTQVSGSRKKRALFFLLMKVGACDKTVLAYINEQAQKMPQYFSGPVLARLNRFLPLA